MRKMKWYKTITLILALCLSQFNFGQDSNKGAEKLVTITGKVINLKNEPVEGAVFYVDNIKTTITSKANGKYKIKVSPSAQNLEVRSTGYGTSVTPIKGMTLINFLLEGSGDSTMLIAEKPPKPKTKMNTYKNIYEMIRGELSGVVVSGRSIQIQQPHSFYGGGTPLFTVNGNIVQSIDYINPVEVKSIKLIKGSAAAIYGVNGSNGVISIVLVNGTDR
jgi:hypothetical protein